jgi:RHS repeat-associated protein
MGGTSYKFHYVFNYTDHLGNIRLSYSKDPATNALKIIEENHYYPFGLKHSGYNSDKMMYVKEVMNLKIKPVPPLLKTVYNYKYNGKEYQDELGLNMYDYGARNYDPALGRWMNVDPLAEKLPHASPYAFCLNNPILFVDPDGQFPWPWFRLMFVGKASKTSDNNAFKQAATNLNKEYTDSKASIFYISTGKEIVNEINNSSKKIQSIDFFSHSGHNGMFFTHDEWLGDNDFYINDAEENKVAGYWTNDSADLSEIDYTKFTNDAKVEFHGCNSGNKDFADNMASEFSKSMYGAGKTKSVAIGHGTKANPNSETLGNDYRHGLRRVYHNGTELFTTKREGRIPSRIINRFLKQKEKQGESYDGSNQRW